jgi:hypothetical protein
MLSGDTVLSGNLFKNSRNREDDEEDSGEEEEWDEDKGSVTESEYKKYVKDADIEDYLRGE